MLTRDLLAVDDLLVRSRDADRVKSDTAVGCSASRLKSFAVLLKAICLGQIAAASIRDKSAG